MSIELRVVGGARAGFREVFAQPFIAIGRHPSCDFQLDATRDLDVSTRHAEIRRDGERWILRDNGSTNGTYLNGRRLTDPTALAHGDVIRLGSDGPSVEVVLPNAFTGATAPVGAVMAAPAGRSALPPVRASTEERVRVAVRHETAWMRRLLAGAVVVLVAGAGAAYWLGHRASQAEVQQLLQLLAQSESSGARLRAQLAAVGDTSLLNALARQQTAIATRVQNAHGSSTAELDSLRAELLRRQRVQQGLVAMDVSAISERNDGAVAFLASELDGRPYGGTAFGITTGGLLVTNRHNVRTDAGHRATRLGVTFANTDNFRPAHVVAVSEEADLALVQVDEPGTYPAVAGIAPAVATLRVGAPIVTIGFPLAMDAPMEGDAVKTSLTAGTVSKVLPSVLQIDAFANHGSSGSPVFGGDGRVVGVVYGGLGAAQGRIVLAVPSDRLARLIARNPGGTRSPK